MQLTLEKLAERVETLERRLAQLGGNGDPVGAAGDPQSDDPEAISQWIAAFDAIPPLRISADEEAAWQAGRTTQRTLDTIAFDRLATMFPKAPG